MSNLHAKKILLIVYLFAQSALSVDVDLYFQNKKSNEQLQNKNPAMALTELYKIVPRYPQEFILSNNIGNNLEVLGQPEKAEKFYQKAYELALKDQDAEKQFVALFNIAQLQGQQKKVDEALKNYQKALKLNPESIETKTNIELLTQSQGGQGGSSDQEQKKDQNQNQDQNQEQKQDQQKKYEENKQYKPRPYQGKELAEGDVKKIFDELKQQEQKIRKEYNKDQNQKESDNGKSW